MGDASWVQPNHSLYLKSLDHKHNISCTCNGRAQCCISLRYEVFIPWLMPRYMHWQLTLYVQIPKNIYVPLLSLQDPVLFSGSLRSNLDPFKEHTDHAIWDAVTLAHLHTFIDGHPDGLEYDVGDGGEALRYGVPESHFFWSLPPDRTMLCERDMGKEYCVCRSSIDFNCIHSCPQYELGKTVEDLRQAYIWNSLWFATGERWSERRTHWMLNVNFPSSFP